MVDVFELQFFFKVVEAFDSPLNILEGKRRLLFFSSESALVFIACCVFFVSSTVCPLDHKVINACFTVCFSLKFSDVICEGKLVLLQGVSAFWKPSLQDKHMC